MRAVAGHPLTQVLRDAAAGRSPPADGRVRVLPALPGPVHAILGFTAHHVVAAPVSVAEVDQALMLRDVPGPGAPAESTDDVPPGPADLGAPLKAPFVTWLAQRVDATPGSIDLVLIAPARPATPPLALRRRDDLGAHPRVRRAHRYRSDLEVFTDSDARGVLLIGRGLAGRLELAFEVDASQRGRGVARGLAAAAAERARDEPLFAQVAAANTAALHVLLAAGFRPIGAEVLFNRAG